MNISVALLLISNLIILVSTAYNKDEYGPYSVVWKNLALCEGPKKGECGTASMEVDKDAGIIEVSLNITKICSISQAKITMYSVKNNAKKKVIDYNMDKPCQHFLVGALISMHMNATANCRVAKAFYKAVINLNDCTSKFVGDNFFYGEYYYKSIFADKQKNILCVQSSLVFEKPNKVKSV